MTLVDISLGMGLLWGLHSRLVVLSGVMKGICRYSPILVVSGFVLKTTMCLLIFSVGAVLVVFEGFPNTYV